MSNLLTKEQNILNEIDTLQTENESLKNENQDLKNQLINKELIIENINTNNLQLTENYNQLSETNKQYKLTIVT